MEEDHGPLAGLEVREMEELIKQLEEQIIYNTAIATMIRTEEMEKRFFLWKQTDLMEKAIGGLRRNIPQEMEIEGSGSSWWYVCPECHEIVGWKDRFCSNCGQAVKK